MKKLLLVASTVILCGLSLMVSEAHAQLPPCQPGGPCLYGGSATTINSGTLRVEGYGLSYVNYLAGLMYHPAVEAWLYRADLPYDFDYRYNRGVSSAVAAQVWLSTTNFVPGRLYCTYSRHYLVSREYIGQHIYGGDWEDCKLIPSIPTPTPTITPPTPTPTPTPCDFLSGLPCQTPTPTPTPTPITMEINTVGFDDDFPIHKAPAPGVLITDPTWTKGSPNNAGNVVAYKQGTDLTKVKMDATFTLSSAPPQALSVKVKVKYGGREVAITPNPISVTGNSFSVDNLTLNDELEETAKVKKGTYQLTWETTVNNGASWQPAGTSQHVIYWTYGDVVEPAGCGTDGEKRNCLFVNKWGDVDWPNLYNTALERVFLGLQETDQTPDQIAKRLAWYVDHSVVYNPSNDDVDLVHPLVAFNTSSGVQCSVNANLLRGLLRSIGVNNAETVYVWGGKPNNANKREDETGGMTYAYKVRTHSTSTGNSSDFHYSFQAIRPRSNEGAIDLQKDPHFTFHAMVKVQDAPDNDITNLAARYYDPSYAKRLEANQSRYPDYPYINSALKFRKVANLDPPDLERGRFVEEDATMPFVVRALRDNSCLPNDGATCPATLTRVKRGVLPNLVAALPRISVFDAQGVSTFTVWRPSDGYWYTHNAYDGTYRYGQWGVNGDKPMPGDFDGDGRTDYSIFRPSNTTVYIFESDTNTFRTFLWNSATDKPVYGDFDGDGLSDIAFYRPVTQGGEWHITRSSDGTVYTSLFEHPGVPVSGDFDGDGRTDVAVYKADRWGTWMWMTADGSHYGQETGGGATDVPIPGDYDGDGRTDFALFRPSDRYWQIYNSGNTAYQFYFGVAGDLPVPGDYDGDGVTDPAIWSPSSGYWTVRNSLDGTTTSAGWGGQSHGDVPVGRAYIY